MVSLDGAPLCVPSQFSVMASRLRHRGPDGHGEVLTPDAAIGVERLAIRDRRPNADQPVRCRAGTLACNGEIYNAPVLRRRYPDHPYRSRSDVEPLVPLLSHDGVEALAHVRGMFGLAWWTPRTRTLLLARDRAGEKPLFYRRIGSEVWFSSEPQALYRPGETMTIDPDGLAAYLALGYLPEPLSLAESVAKVPANGWIRFARGHAPESGMFPPVSPVTPRPGREIGDLEVRLHGALLGQLQADVPVGVFLSGGVDSSLLAALTARALAPHPVPTFSLAFADRGYDERAAARTVAHRLRSVHREIVLDDDGLCGMFDVMTHHLGEPLADPALLPTAVLARAARRHVGVVLSGEGADELFGGYPTYLGHWLADRWPAPLGRGARVPTLLVHRAASPGRVTPAFLLERFLRHRTDPWGTRHLAWYGTGLSPCLTAEARDRVLRAIGADRPAEDSATAAMTLDFRTSLRDGLLVKLDRATMATGLEARAPYLDPTLTACVAGLSKQGKLGLPGRKHLLKQVAAPYLDPATLRRPKHGLSVPVARLLRTRLAEVAARVKDLEEVDAVRTLLQPRVIRELLTGHQAGRANHARPLWALVMLREWMATWSSGVSHDTS